ncbi:glycine-rich protein 5-like [Vicia villosa]|uniref:glycine-rich protein 5-like n=1 Tax=Vicia villosa TaxID=3911 RepID=UPI00273C94B0|nr:glycine-rich protein 5-like [Vicia villosa]
MNIKSFIFVFFLYALIFITVVATEPSKDDGKQIGTFENSKTKLGVNEDVGIGGSGDMVKGHNDNGLGFWINGGGWGGSIESGDFKGSINIGGAQGGGENNGLGGQSELGNEVAWSGGGESSAFGFGGQRERGNEIGWRGGENSAYGGQGGRRNDVSWKGGENRGFGGEEGESEGFAGLWDHKN